MSIALPLPMSNPNASDRSKARALAVLMHVLFVLLIVFGVSWQKKPQTPVVAELWSNLPPVAQPPQPQVEVPPRPEPTPEPPPKPVPRVAPPPPKVEAAPAPKPDIALKKKAEAKSEPKPETKPEPKKREEDKVALQKKAAEDKARREEREQETQKRAAEQEAAAKAEAEKAAAERAARAASAREMQKYINGIYGKVWARVAVPSDMQGNPEAVFTVSLLPGGELESAVMTKSSGNAAYDAAIERAIRQAQPFVVPTGDEFHRNFRRFPMVFRPQR